MAAEACADSTTATTSVESKSFTIADAADHIRSQRQHKLGHAVYLPSNDLEVMENGSPAQYAWPTTVMYDLSQDSLVDSFVMTSQLRVRSVVLTSEEAAPCILPGSGSSAYRILCQA